MRKSKFSAFEAMQIDETLPNISFFSFFFLSLCLLWAIQQGSVHLGWVLWLLTVRSENDLIRNIVVA